MKINSKFLTASTLIVGAISGAAIMTTISPNSAFADETDCPRAEQGLGNRGQMNEHREAARTAIENNDYNAWATAMTDAPEEMQNKVNEQTFANLKQAHQLRAEGKYEEARTLMESIGFGHRGNGPKNGQGPQDGQGPRFQNQ